MVETLQNLQHVYAKWESRNPWRQPGDPKVTATAATGAASLSAGAGRNGDTDYNRLMENGRQSWNQRFSSTGLPPPRQNRYRRNRGVNSGQAALSLATVNAETLGSFKTAPTVSAPLSGRLRPFMGRCCGCMPASKAEFFDSSIPHAGLYNMLNIDTARKENGVLTRLFAQAVYAWRRKMDHKYPDVSMDVITSAKVNEAIQKTVQENTESEGALVNPKQLKKVQKAERKRTLKVMKRMRAEFSNRLVRITAWFMHHLFGRLLSGVVVHRGQLQLLRRATEKGLPVIFLPTHRSHLDYILITWVLFNIDIKAPYVAAGDNLLIPLFGYLMRGLGGYFIRRKIDKYGKKDHTYRAVLQVYMQELLRQGEFFEIFIEGGRTRSGKALVPKGGLLSVIVDAYNEGIIPDAVLVPISISYDRILDGNFNNEQMGKPKVHETFIRACISIWKVLSGHFGSVRIDFCQPFSLQEYIQVAHGFPAQPAPLPASPTLDSSGGSSSGGGGPTGGHFGGVNGVVGELGLKRGSNHSLYGTDCVVEDMRLTIQGLAEHVVYNQSVSQAIKAGHILAFIMLYKYPQGAELGAVVQMFDWLRQEVTNHNRDLGFSGKTCDAIEQACKLHEHLINREVTRKQGSTQVPAADSEIFLTPVTTLPEVFNLAYYANIVTPIFAMESVIANAIHVSVSSETWLTPMAEGEKTTVSRDKIIRRAMELCRMLKYEYIFAPSCTRLLEVISDGIDQLLASEILITDQEVRLYQTTQEKEWADGLSKSLACVADDDSEEDEEEENKWTMDQLYVVNRACEMSMEKYQLLRGVVAPILECYFIVVCNLTKLEEAPMLEADFVKTVHNQLIERVQTGLSSCGESAALDTVKNGIRGLQYIKVLDAYPAKDNATVNMLALNPAYREEKLTDFIVSLEAYRL